jgi:hypothetical protein
MDSGCAHAVMTNMLTKNINEMDLRNEVILDSIQYRCKDERSGNRFYTVAT